MSQNTEVSDKRAKKPKFITILMGLLTIFGFPLGLFLTAGRWDWLEGWIYIALFMVSVLVSRIYLVIKNPDLAAERAHSLSAENVKGWDRWLMPIVATIGPLLVLIVAGLDERYGWLPELSIGIKIAAAIVILAGYVVSIWAMNVNRFFSGTVRIQTDRSHQVVSDGPYRLVRHPGYLGGLLSYFGLPFLLGSLWALIPAVLTILAVVLRTVLEDETLQKELPGYRAYAQKIRSKLIPGIW
jgi:protein-S-isoprenylcysteine O-methyltransferase Ste14